MRKHRSLVLVLMMIVLCATIIVGSTMAYYTDEVPASENLVTSGDLEVKFEWADKLGEEWQDAASAGPIFNQTHWEPNFTTVKYIQVSNTGDMPFQYELNVVPTLVPEEGVNLMDVIDVYFGVVDENTPAITAANYADELQKVDNLTALLKNENGAGYGIVLPKDAKGTLPQGAIAYNESVTVCIALHMQHTAGNEYMNRSVGEGFNVQLAATQYTYDDAFGTLFSGGAQLPEVEYATSKTVSVTPDENGLVPYDIVFESDTGVIAVVPKGAKMEQGANQLILIVYPKAKSDANLSLQANEVVNAWEVKVEGLADDNTLPVRFTLPEAMQKGLNIGNYSLYHVENGASVPMTRVEEITASSAHNSFSYNPATGDMGLALATFSEIAIVSEPAKWEGNYDYSWYTNAVMPFADSEADYIIANADQLAAFGAIVGGMNGQAQDSFSGKTVKLIADINLGDKESENNADIIFYPIGYYNSEGTYERTNTAITSGLRNFEGIFDGNGHTISNFYQNTWEMKGDNNYYDATLQYYRDGMGLFGKVYGGTVKNLTVSNFSSDGEYTTTGVIAAYADGATFENIAVTNCNPRVYNIGNGGIVGCVGRYAKEANLKTTFTNITVDNSNKISALWGSYDVACGGIVGQYYPTSGQTSAGELKNAGIDFVNCHVSAQMDVYNDVCGNYQYYAYRYAGMMIGSIRENETIDGRVYPKMDGISASGCTVNFGTWNDYYYCELVANSLASYTHDHQFSRLEQVTKVEGTTITPLEGDAYTVPSSGRYNYVVVNGEHATDNANCYHFVDGAVWNHEDAGKETVNGVEVLKEDKQHIYLEFGQLFTGYGWGVTSKGLTDFEGIETMGITSSEHQASVEKFNGKVTELSNNKEYKLGDIFSFVDNGVELVPDALIVTVTNLDENNPVSATIVYDKENWENGTLTLNGTGEVTIGIQDYYFCKPTVITVDVTARQPEVKFDIVMNNGDFLHRVGNSGTVALDKLFRAKNGATIGTVSVTVEAVGGTGASGTYSNNAIQFSGTGVVKVTITDNDYCIPTELYLEVVDAVNATAATNATANNVVLLNDVTGSFSVSGGNTVYGNGFKVTLPTTVQSKYSAGYVGYVTMSGGNLDNVRIEGPVYPEMYIYREQAIDSADSTKANYFFNSILINEGNNTISNSYVSGSRTAICIRGGNNITIENTTLYGGAYANMHIAGASSVTLRDLTTVQVDVADSYGKGKTAHGLGIAVDSNVVDIYIEGELNQYNWLNQTQWNSIVPSDYQSMFPKFFTDNSFNKHWHYLNGGTNPYVNLAFIYACDWDTSKIHDNRTTVDYGTTAATINKVDGGVYSKVNTVGGNAIVNADLADPGYVSPGFNPVAPKFTFDNTANNDADDENDANDTYCVYDEASGVLKIGVSGNNKALDLSGVTVKKNGVDLTYTVYKNGTQVSGNSVEIKAADGAKQTLIFKATSDDAGYDKDGNPIAGSIEYTWTVTVEMAVLAYPAPVWNMGGDYQFDTSNCIYAYYLTSQGYGEAVPIYEGIKVNYYNKSGTLVKLDLSGTTTFPTGSDNKNANAFTYTLADGSTLTMKFSSGWKSGAITHQFTTYNNKVYIYPQSLDNDNYVRAKTTNQDFDVKITYTFTDPNGQSTEAQTMQWYNAKTSNGSVKTVQWKTFDSTNGKKTSTCVTPDTLVTLADGSKKEIRNVNYEDQLLVWDFYKGEYAAVPASIISNHGYANNKVIALKFSDGTEVKAVNDHVFMDATLNKMVLIDDRNVQDYVGHSFVKANGDGYTTVELVEYKVTEEYIEAWGILTAGHYNAMVEDMFSIAGSAEEMKAISYFEIGEGMKYDEAVMQADIEKYGLYSYEEFVNCLTEEQFEALGVKYMKVSVGKGLITRDYIMELINTYIK